MRTKIIALLSRNIRPACRTTDYNYYRIISFVCIMKQLIERERINLSLTAFNGFKPKCECYTKNVVIIFVLKNHMHMFRVNLVSEDVRVQEVK